ncbi:hypothetical protein BT63DRAFT_421905 [Microthyrium microscopicum]|uniref:Uncharacterized protein n=1 Tax=Microthyrium microscopicum TaxID=703497 RepID=A0A6A6UPX3_9PEZI|nr:hypothetical protein BT63DRAFT_421905 [Microthyrium microscopicum]
MGNTVGSYKVMVGATFTKLRRNNCFLGGPDVDNDENGADCIAPAKKGGRKRAAATDGEGAPATKKRASKKKAAKIEAVPEDAENEGSGDGQDQGLAVKMEPEEHEV